MYDESIVKDCETLIMNLNDMVRRYSKFLEPLSLKGIRELAAEREKAMQLNQGKSLVGYLDKLISKPQNQLDQSVISRSSGSFSKPALPSPKVNPTKNLFGKALNLIGGSKNADKKNNLDRNTYDESIDFGSPSGSPRRASEASNRSSINQLSEMQNPTVANTTFDDINVPNFQNPYVKNGNNNAGGSPDKIR